MSLELSKFRDASLNHRFDYLTQNQRVADSGADVHATLWTPTGYACRRAIKTSLLKMGDLENDGPAKYSTGHEMTARSVN